MGAKLKDLYHNSMGKWELIKQNLSEFNWENSDDFEIQGFLIDLRNQIYSRCIFCFDCDESTISEDVDDCCNCRIDRSICDGNGHFGLLGKINARNYNFSLSVQGNKDFIENLNKSINSILEVLKKEYDTLNS